MTRRWLRAGTGLALATMIASCTAAAAPANVAAPSALKPSTAADSSPSALTASSASAAASASVAATLNPTPSAPTPTPRALPTPVQRTPPTATERPSGHRPSGSPTPAASGDIQSYLTASISLTDLADADLGVTVTYIDPASGQSAALGSFSLHAFDEISRLIPPGRYQLDFRQPPTSTSGPRCTVAVRKGDAYTFAAVANGIVVGRQGDTPTTLAELFVASSPLCKG